MLTYTIKHTHDEIQEIAAFVDLSLKSVGLQVLKPAAALIAKLEAAQPDTTEPIEEVEIS